ncbi:hypothetical protein [Erwinia sp. OPT-41]|jgi:predicted RNase H-like nuclease (RuvC/YqgF family)|uniref:Uncharacterized protein n=1 Tax=Erwinia plantamica TaxID=3237104 RepID=A0ABW7CNE7_9GAMM
MFAETTAAITAAKEAYALVKVLKDAREQSVIDKATGELHEKITELQMLNAELASLYHAEKQVTMQLTEENAQIKMFALQSSQYEIHTMESGSTVYRLKAVPDPDMKTHYLCANCYQKREISILQPTGKVIADSASNYCKQSLCPACGTTFLMHRLPKKEKYIPQPISRKGGW